MKLWPFARRDRGGFVVGHRIRESAADDAEAFRRGEYDEDGNPLPGSQGLGGAMQADATSVERQKAITASRRLYRRSGIYGQMVDIYVGWIVGDGVQLKALDEKADAWLQEVLEDPANSFGRRLRERVRRGYVDGELPLTVSVPITGQAQGGKATLAGAVRFGRLLPETITETRLSRVDHGRVLSILVRDQADQREQEYPIAEVDVDPVPVVESKGAPPKVAAAVAFFRVNVIEVRGLPMFSRTLDKAAMLDEAMEHIIRKTEYTNRFWLVATYKPSASKDINEALEKKIEEWLKKAKQGAYIVAPDGFKLEAIAPKLELMDFKALYEIVIDWILGSHGIPRMWFSSGGDTNRATSVEQGTPIARQIRGHQTDLQAFLEDLGAYIVYLGIRAGRLAEGTPTECEAVMPDVATRDSVRDTTELAGLITALNELAAAKCISPLERQKIARKVLGSKVYGDQLEDDAPTLEEDGDQAVTLNGAQLQVLDDIVTKVSAGEMPKDTGVQFLAAVFQIAPEQAEKMLAPAEEFAGDAQKAKEAANARANDLMRGMAKGKGLAAPSRSAPPRNTLREAVGRALTKLVAPGHRRWTTLPDGTRQLRVKATEEQAEAALAGKD
jgi:hypothetical protein